MGAAGAGPSARPECHAQPADEKQNNHPHGRRAETLRSRTRNDRHGRQRKKRQQTQERGNQRGGKYDFPHDRYMAIFYPGGKKAPNQKRKVPAGSGADPEPRIWIDGGGAVAKLAAR